jgi:hypothetical protein
VLTDEVERGTGDKSSDRVISNLCQARGALVTASYITEQARSGLDGHQAVR